ncbi:MAG: Hpt domain-containing protein, partial [Gammaproteobacteria bacterium]|nr:Hpt domain-containing protein [Gammaproteobacteria bacterium]
TLELTDTDAVPDDFTLELTDTDAVPDDFTLELADTDIVADGFETDEISLDGLSLADDELDDGLSFDLEDTSLEEGISLDELSEVNVQEESKAEEVIEAPVAAPAQTPKNKEPSLLDDTIDDEIIEIFIEEAEEAYESISQLLPVWAANNADDVSLKEIRRAYHTLKGSGRLVGAVELGEFAWAFENMLNRLLDKTIKVSADLLEVMELGKQALPKLFDLFKTNSKAGQDILVLMQYADALSKGESITINAPVADVTEVTETAAEENTGEEEILSFDAVDVEEDIVFDAPVTEELILDETVEAEEIIPIEVAEEPAIEVISEELPFPVDIDPTLLEIYRKEVATHTDALRIYISGWHTGSKGVSFVVLRALHTLTGSSRTTGVQSLAQVCSSFEHYVKHLQDTNGKVSKAAIDELENTILLIEETVKCLDVPGAELPDHNALLARVEALANDIQAEQVTEAVSPTTTEEPVITVAAEEPAVDLPMPDYDEELLEIFLEEGTEILDESDQTIHDWISNPQDDEYVKALQRQLHTLKGGARMAGISELGDLGHSIESLLTAVVDGHMKPSKRMFDLVQRSQDRLVKMLELVQSHKGLAAAKDLIREVDFMLENRGADEDMPVPETETEELMPVASVLSEEPEESLSALNDALTLDDNDFSVPDETEIVATEDLSFDIDEPYLDAEANLAEESAKLENEDLAPSVEIEIPDLVDELVELESDLGKELDNVVELKQPQQAVTIETVEEEVEEKPVAKTEAKLPAEDEGDRRKGPRVQAEQVRVRADLLDNLVNFAGEVSIYRSRLEQQTNNFRYNIAEFDDTVNRLREQLRQFEIETEAQIEYRNEETLSNAQMDFDPLEMDRFTTMQHLSRAMMESLGDLDSLRGILNNLTRESETLLLQQSRVNTDLQEGLMRTRMVPFSGQAARLRRIVRQTCGELGKHAELDLTGIETELDRTVLERIIPPIEHMLRNAVAHGIESPEVRKKSGKPETGEIKFSIANEGSEIVIRIKDDGAGINLDAIREKAISRGLISADAPVSKDVLLDMIMQSGFSTAESVNQIAGRGVGMDVVNTEIKQLGGIFNINTAKDKGTTFTVSLPLTLAISRALMVMIGEDTYAVPLLSVEGVERISSAKIKEIIAQDNPVYNWVGEDYKFMHLGSVMGISEMRLADDKQQLPMLMIRSGESRAAILVDALLGSREIVVKSVGPQLSTLRGISGATVMGDGSVVLIIDLGMLIRLAATVEMTEETLTPIATDTVQAEDTSTLVMVVDDSITVRKVTTRLLERHDMRVVSAKDGVDALAQLQEVTPDIMLLDVEMPRMDGFELATNMRNDERLQNVPIIMITSRTGQKHRDRAASIGVNIYMGKPFTETDLMNNINVLTGKDD